jgi:hypothetical protein
MFEHKPYKEFDVRYRMPGKWRWTKIKFYSNPALPGQFETVKEVLGAFAKQWPGADIKVTDLGWR